MELGRSLLQYVAALGVALVCMHYVEADDTVSISFFHHAFSTPPHSVLPWNPNISPFPKNLTRNYSYL